MNPNPFNVTTLTPDPTVMAAFDAPLAAVTGAFSYSGKYITRRLLAAGAQVLNLSGSPHRPDPFNGRVQTAPFNFDHPEALAASLQGVDTLYNTYWVRFDHAESTYTRAVANTRTLLHAAQAAGVRRFVHISITNPSASSPLPYFKGKADLEEAVRSSGLSYAILRPTVIFGLEEILINNIAWLLRRFPAFTIPGSGKYALQPIYVEDLAALAVQAAGSSQDMTLDAVGPEIYTFEALVRLLAQVVESRALIFHAPVTVSLWLSRIVGALTGDVVLTNDEIVGLMAGLLVSQTAPTGTTSLKTWLYENRSIIGRRYASEIKRHYRPKD